MESNTTTRTPDVEQLADDARTWWFTFGPALAGRYVTIAGTFMGARQEATRRFGPAAWTGQFATAAEAGVVERLLTEIGVAELDERWPDPEADDDPNTLPAAEIEAGTSICIDGRVAQVRYADTYPHPDSREPWRLLVLADAHVVHVPAEHLIGLATEDDIAAAEADARRAKVVAALRALADQIERDKLPTPRKIQVSGYIGDADAVRRMAELVPGAALTEGIGDDRHVTVTWGYPHDAESYAQHAEIALSAHHGGRP